MATWQLSPRGAILIYAILVLGLVAILIVWAMLPKAASSVEIYDITGAKVAGFAIMNVGDTLRCKIDDTAVRVYYNGVTHVFPMANIRSIDLRP